MKDDSEMINELELTRQQVCDILGVTKSSLKKNRKQRAVTQKAKRKGI